jgi:hypothetical protein
MKRTPYAPIFFDFKRAPRHDIRWSTFTVRDFFSFVATRNTNGVCQLMRFTKKHRGGIYPSIWSTGNLWAKWCLRRNVTRWNAASTFFIRLYIIQYRCWKFDKKCLFVWNVTLRIYHFEIVTILSSSILCKKRPSSTGIGKKIDFCKILVTERDFAA